jgi:tetratricopeptide (TPR) repeat protein
MQLQVVCHRIWSRLAPKAGTSITEEEVKQSGEVDNALADYYREQVHKSINPESAGERALSRERALRDWIEGKLITDKGLRGLASEGDLQGAGVELTAVDQMIDAYLVRKEEGRGTTWFELSHDRLIDPIKTDNARWRDEHLNTFQKQAKLWINTPGQPEDLLVQGNVLAEGERWAEAHQGDLTKDEERFLKACQDDRAARLREQEQERSRLQAERNAAQARYDAELAKQQTAARLREARVRELTRIAIMCFMAAVIMTVLGIFAMTQRNKARESEATARKFLDIVDQMLSQVAAVELADVPEMQPVLEKLLGHALEGLRSSLKEKRTDLAVRDLEGRTYVLVGELRASLGEMDNALLAYDNALHFLEQVALQRSTDAVYRRDLARCYNDRGILFRKTSRLREAEADLSRALSLWQELASDGKPDYRRQLEESRYNLATVLARMGMRDEEAKRVYREAVEGQIWLVEQDPDNPQHQLNLARTYINQGILLDATGEPLRAENKFRDALAILKRLPSAASQRRLLARCYNNLANLLSGNESVQQHQIWAQVVGIFAFGSSGALHALPLLYVGPREEAILYYRIGRDEFAQLVADFPAVPDYQQWLASLYRNLGNLLQDLRRDRDAKTAFRDALRIAEELCRKYPDRPDYQMSLADIYESLAGFLEPRQAVSFYDQALAIRRKLLASFPSGGYQKDLARTLYNFAATQVRLKNFIDAAALAEELPQISPDDPEQYGRAATLLAYCASLASEAKRPDLMKTYKSRQMELMNKAKELKKSRPGPSACAPIGKATRYEVSVAGAAAYVSSFKALTVQA